MKVPYIDLSISEEPLKSEIMGGIEKVLDSGQYILGKYVDEFESRFAEYNKSTYAVGVDNGTSALILSLRALGIGPGDEVITVSNSYLSTAASIALIGATPVFVDVDETYNIDVTQLVAAITDRTKAIIPVHLTGRPCNMNSLMKIADEYKLEVIEDSAQAIGAKIGDQNVGTFGNLGCFSFHPLKNLGACGDGGAILTNDSALYEKLKILRNHGLVDRDRAETWSHNCRLDALQASILDVKMNYLDQWTEQRRANSDLYSSLLCESVKRPAPMRQEFSVYHTYVVLVPHRQDLQDHLDKKGIETKIHYPIPIHLQPASKYLGYTSGSLPNTESQSESILSLPISPHLTKSQIEYVCEHINRFYQ